MRRLQLFAAVLALVTLPGVSRGDDPPQAIDIGTRVEMFVDRFLIESMSGTELHLTEPVRREVVLVTDQPWEDVAAGAYSAVIQDGGKIRLYYRGAGMPADPEDQNTCYAESDDGINFTRPMLGIYEFNGSKENNIIHRGGLSAAFAPFLDTNPDAPPEQRYKAVAAMTLSTRLGAAFAFASPDGIHWKQISDEPMLPPASFDTLNTAHWDAHAKVYRMYSRYWTRGNFAGYRGIQSSTSPDFRTWSAPQGNVYAEGVPLEHLYTNAVVPCPGAEHIRLSFAMRFMPQRKAVPEHTHNGVSDAVFMTSRDGVHWDRTFMQAWMRPGHDRKNWTDRSNIPAWGIVQLSPDEFTMYISEHYRWPDNRLRRITIRRHGFASVRAGYDGGEVITKPLRFSGKNLIINYATSAAGSVRVELQDTAGKAIEGFGLEQCAEIYGDELDRVVSWSGGADVSALAGQALRLRFVLKDADVYAFRTGEP